MTYKLEYEITGKADPGGIVAFIGQVSKLGHEISESNKRAESFKKAVEAKKFKDFATEIESAARRAQAMKGALGQAGTALEGFNKNILDSSAGLLKFAGAAGPIGAAVAGIVAGRGAVVYAGYQVGETLFNLSRQVAEHEAQYARLGSTLGASAEFLSSWDYVVQRSGGDTDNFHRSLAQLNTNLGLFAATGGGPAEGAFKALGLEADIASGKIGNVGQLLPLLADRFAAIASPADRSAVAVRLFGEQGAGLAAVLAQGNPQINEMIARFIELSGVVSGEAAASARNFEIAMGDLNTATLGLKSALADELIPAFTSLVSTGAGVLSWLSQTVDWSNLVSEAIGGAVWQ